MYPALLVQLYAWQQLLKRSTRKVISGFASIGFSKCKDRSTVVCLVIPLLANLYSEFSKVQDNQF